MMPGLSAEWSFIALTNRRPLSVKQIDEVLRAVESGANVEFTVGIIRARGENHELAALTLKAR